MNDKAIMDALNRLSDTLDAHAGTFRGILAGMEKKKEPEKKPPPLTWEELGMQIARMDESEVRSPVMVGWGGEYLNLEAQLHRVYIQEGTFGDPNITYFKPSLNAPGPLTIIGVNGWTTDDR